MRTTSRLARSHRCPAPGCTVQVDEELLACRDHWFALPKELRVAIWRAYKRGDTVEHRAHVAKAIRLWQEAS